jgi:hypothetical protein
MKGEGPDSCAVLTATTSGHPLSGATGAMEDHPTSIQVYGSDGPGSATLYRHKKNWGKEDF